MIVAQICDHIKTIELYVNFSGIGYISIKLFKKILNHTYKSCIYIFIYKI